MPAHTPLQDGRTPCGCVVRYDYDGPTVLEYCPLHAAAPALLEALEDEVKWLDSVIGCRDITAIRIGARSRLLKSRAAIALAKGETV